MNSFLDSNVIVGYIFCIDSLFNVSEEVIFKSSATYYSQNVKLEVNAVFNRKSHDYSKFFSKLFWEISQFNDLIFLSRHDIHRIISYFRNIGYINVGEMHWAFELIWNILEFGENQEVVI